MIKLSQPEGYDWLSALEGARLKAYQDENFVWTIGVGTTTYPDTNEPVKKGDVLPSYEALRKLLEQDLVEFEECVTKSLIRNDIYIRNGGPFPAHVTDPLISFCFNIGTPRFRASTALKRFNENFPIGAVAEAMSWYRRPNLESRRDAEKRCLIGGIYSDQSGRLTSKPNNV